MIDLKDQKLVLASASPRRKELLSGLNIPFEIRINDLDEDYPPEMDADTIAIYLAEKKADFYFQDKDEKEIIITCDTTVVMNGKVYNKPIDKKDALRMLKTLSGNDHEVITGVCIRSYKKSVSFDTRSYVKFKELEDDEINYYIDHYKPFDKAGSYGIQEWLGYIAIEKIEGSYFNIMGLPVHRIYEELKRF